MNTLLIKRRGTEDKLLGHVRVTGKRNPGENYGLQKYTDIFSLPYEYVISSILCRKTTALRIEHKPV